MATKHVHGRIRKLLKDPNICVIKTPVGPYRVYRHWFEQLCRLPWLRKAAPRIASVADGFAVIVSEKEFYAYRTERPPVEPSLPTFAQQVDQAWIYTIASRSLSPVERQEQATRDYALFCVLEAA